METTGFGPSSCATGITSSQPGRPEKLAISRWWNKCSVYRWSCCVLFIAEPFHIPSERMQFTPQQLAGGGSYDSVTRIGNWREEIALAEAKLKEFRNNSSGGSLHLRKQQNKLSKCLQLVSTRVFNRLFTLSYPRCHIATLPMDWSDLVTRSF
jgi:hypothetical protein